MDSLDNSLEDIWQIPEENQKQDSTSNQQNDKSQFQYKNSQLQYRNLRYERKTNIQFDRKKVEFQSHLKIFSRTKFLGIKQKTCSGNRNKGLKKAS